MTLKEAVEILKASGISDPRDEARRIFSSVGRVRDCELLSMQLSTDNEAVINAVMRRAKREPLQYIIGEAYFFRERYKVTQDTLIPRSDTEVLVEYAVNNLPAGCRFLDLCTGSGCIALSVLNNTENTTALAVDISGGALAVARENAESLGIADRIELMLADALLELDCGEIFALLANPPYVSDSAYGELEAEIYFEPRSAFVGGVDGGDFYRIITPLYKDKIAEEGFIAYEIGYDQRELLESIAKDNSMSAEIIKDLSGNDRVAVLRKITE